LFITLTDLYVEGLVHITELGGEYFRFDEARQELRGERTGVRYAIGTRVRVQVSRVDLDGRRIDFRLVREDLPDGVREGRTAPAAAPVRAPKAKSVKKPAASKARPKAIAKAASKKGKRARQPEKPRTARR
jgi:ribonuclease R